jgi:HAD superfamily hydrolase (TIGR01509 family)
MTRIAAILWDMDGVLADTGSLHYETWKLVLDAQGIPFDREIFSKTFGRNNASSLEMVLGHPPSAELLDLVDTVKEQTFRQLVPERVRLLPGVISWLEAFRQRNLPQVVASSAPQENIDLLVEVLGIRAYFTHLISGHDMPGKPEPAVFLEAARRVGMPPEACLVIEDSPAGVQGALRAGMRCLGVATTHLAEQLLEASLVVAGLAGMDVAEMMRRLD